eukprot:TRINITY_DN28402_c0_g1_i4.p2 TRINITY_DN28402_c0_g1~~TRINITY_DN28402_c0_g1_i4.p2  ORF type:complete len:111 (-),score=14.71 TRINITY_DN28402_c0_g1_i4:706-1038(-)
MEPDHTVLRKVPSAAWHTDNFSIKPTITASGDFNDVTPRQPEHGLISTLARYIMFQEIGNGFCDEALMLMPPYSSGFCSFWRSAERRHWMLPMLWLPLRRLVCHYGRRTI